MVRSQAAAPSIRMRRVAEQIRQGLAELLARGDIQDDVVASHSITVTDVRLSPDLKLATAYIMPLGGRDLAPVIAALNTHRKFVRSEMARRVNLKFAPDVRFRLDESFEEGDRIDRLLDSEKVKRDTRPAKPVASDE